MLAAAALFFVIAVVAAIFAFGGVLIGAVFIARFIFFVFAVLFVISAVLHFKKRLGRSR